MISLSWKHGKPSEGAKKRFGNAVNGAYPSPAVRVPKMGEHMTVRKSKSACVQRTAAITLPESLVLTFIIGVLAGHAGPKHFSRFGKSELKAAHVQFDALKNSRDQYRFDSGSDLSMKQGLVALTAPAADVPKWEGSYQRTLRLAIPGETPMSISLSPSGRAR